MKRSVNLLSSVLALLLSSPNALVNPPKFVLVAAYWFLALRVATLIRVSFGLCNGSFLINYFSVPFERIIYSIHRL
jgi:ribose/xylose/arabinose/galactoside ABC-type transport system permease subunit